MRRGSFNLTSYSKLGLFLVALVFGVNLASPADSKGQRVKTSRADSTVAALKVDADLVEIPVTVVDKADRIIDNLSKENFSVYENGVEQTVAHFGLYEGPISACLVFDSSGSMERKLQKSIEAVKELLDAAIPDDEYCLVRFNEWAETIVGITDDSARIARALNRIHPGGWTALLDAISLGMEQVKRGHNNRKAIVLISDGGDNRSQRTQQDIKRLVREADAQIYSIGIVSADDQTLYPVTIDGPTLMKTISGQSGGRLFLIHKVDELPSVIAKITMALRHQYLLGYYPGDARNDGKYRRVTVKVNPPRGTPAMRVYWRSGYYAPIE
jgi:Ca-activated chloride channel family protein